MGDQNESSWIVAFLTAFARVWAKNILPLLEWVRAVPFFTLHVPRMSNFVGVTQSCRNPKPITKTRKYENAKISISTGVCFVFSYFRVFVILCVFELESAVLRQTQLLCVSPRSITLGFYFVFS